MNKDAVKAYEKKAAHWAQFLAWLPGVSAIFLSGSLAKGEGSERSDIDLFIVAYPGEICTARFFVATFLRITGQLANHDRAHAGKLCPNHFITTDHLEIEEQDEYAARLFSANRFLAGDLWIWQAFVKVNRDWVQKFGASFVEESQICGEKPEPIEPTGWFGRKLESWCKSYQQKRLDKQDLPPGAKVWIKPHEIRLHPYPKNKIGR